MNHQEYQYVLALQEVKGIGFVNAKKLINNYGSATNLFLAHQSKEGIKELKPAISQQLFNMQTLLKTEKEIEKAIANNLNILYFKEPDFPELLLNCSDGPLLLFYDGVKKLNSFNKTISIVGTRNITPYGRAFCEELIAAVKDYRPLIVSGFAFGVDIAAHTEALKNQLPTLAVLAHGYGTLYPKEHKRFYPDVKESAGFLSEFTYNEAPLRENFLKRNRIVAGISQATIVVESAARGGALVTADIANSYNKDVFAVPGKTTDPYSKGCNNLIKNHKAALITSGQDLITQLGWKQQTTTTQVKQTELFITLEGEEKTLYDLLTYEALHLDHLSRTSGIPIYKVSNLVFQLEMKGLIQVLPGKLIKKTS